MLPRSQQYDTKPEQSSNSTADENESKPAENPAWEKAKQALAKVAASSPQKAAKPKPVQNGNNNVVNAAVAPPYGQYYQPYGYPGYGFPPPPGGQFNTYGYTHTYPPYFQQNGTPPRVSILL